MKTVLVFGINGFIGRHFERFVANKNLQNRYNIIGYSRSLRDTENTGTIIYRNCDLTQYNQVLQLFEEYKPEFVLNLAGTFKADDYEGLMLQNVHTSRNILEAVYKTGAVANVLLVGSAAEYGIPEGNPVTESHPENPVSLYGLSKLYQTQLARFYSRTFHVPVVVARTFNITGAGISEKLSVGNFMRQISEAKDGDTLEVGNLASWRDFLPVESVVKYFYQLLMKGEPGEVYNVCSGKAVQMEEILKELIRQSGKNLAFATRPGLLKNNDVDIIYGSGKKLQSLIGSSEVQNG